MANEEDLKENFDELLVCASLNPRLTFREVGNIQVKKISPFVMKGETVKLLRVNIDADANVLVETVEWGRKQISPTRITLGIFKGSILQIENFNSGNPIHQNLVVNEQGVQILKEG
jgi:hypothetical protein